MGFNAMNLVSEANNHNLMFEYQCSYMYKYTNQMLYSDGAQCSYTLGPHVKVFREVESSCGRTSVTVSSTVMLMHTAASCVGL